MTASRLVIVTILHVMLCVTSAATDGVCTEILSPKLVCEIKAISLHVSFCT